MRQLTGAAVAVAAACALTAVVLAAGRSASPVTKTTPAHGAAGSPPVSAAPYYVVIDSRVGTAAVRRTATGAKIATVRRPRGATFFGVAAAQDDKTFVLAAQISSTTHFYRLRLSARGRPGRLALTAVQPLPRRFGDCPAQLAGLAVSPDARLLALSVLSNCPTGNAGPPGSCRPTPRRAPRSSPGEAWSRPRSSPRELGEADPDHSLGWTVKKR